MASGHCFKQCSLYKEVSSSQTLWSSILGTEDSHQGIHTVPKLKDFHSILRDEISKVSLFI